MNTFRMMSVLVMLAMLFSFANFNPGAASADSPIAHKVSVGGPDFCVGVGLKPGCDANFSLTAIQYTDGSVKGQYTDRFAKGNGIHGVIDCVSVVGNEAWISGVITQGGFNERSFVGLPFSTRVKDNGTSANEPADQISFTDIGDGFARSCNDRANVELFDAPQGQVTVR